MRSRYSNESAFRLFADFRDEDFNAVADFIVFAGDLLAFDERGVARAGIDYNAFGIGRIWRI